MNTLTQNPEEYHQFKSKLTNLKTIAQWRAFKGLKMDHGDPSKKERGPKNDFKLKPTHSA